MLVHQRVIYYTCSTIIKLAIHLIPWFILGATCRRGWKEKQLPRQADIIDTDACTSIRVCIYIYIYYISLYVYIYIMSLYIYSAYIYIYSLLIYLLHCFLFPTQFIFFNPGRSEKLISSGHGLSHVFGAWSPPFELACRHGCGVAVFTVCCMCVVID